MVRRAKIALDAVREFKPKTSQDLAMTTWAPRPARRTATGQDWRWWQDYGAGRLTPEGLALSDEQ
jgi:hypothetical protein